MYDNNIVTCHKFPKMGIEQSEIEVIFMKSKYVENNNCTDDYSIIHLGHHGVQPRKDGSGRIIQLVYFGLL